MLFRSVAPEGAAPAQQRPPRLVVAISIDQFSADLFAQYRRFFTKGLARLQDGAVFPSGFQSHAATETCPGHSTILTGMRPAHTGIIANSWIDQKAARADKNWAESDRLRDEIASRGWQVQDTPEGAKLVKN